MSKIIKAILRISVGVVQLAISLVVIISLISAVTVVMSPSMATFIDMDNAEFNISDPTNSNITLPFNLDNSQGFYDFEDLTIHLEMDIYNTTDNYKILNGTQVFQIPALTNYTDTIFFGNSSFFWNPDLIAGIAMNPTDYNITIFVDLSTTYALGLIPFKLNVTTSMPLSGP